MAFAITGSASMLAEGVHSVADSGNQLLLLLGQNRARRTRTEEHPFGFGRERYFYAFVVAVVLFTVGALFSIYEGIHKIIHPEPITSPVVAFAVLALAIVLESFSLRTAVRESRDQRNGDSWLAFIRRAKAPELPAILLEDMAALTGLLLATAKIAVRPCERAEEIAAGIDAAERRVRAAVPIAKVIYLEPDLYRESRVDATDPAIRAVRRLPGR